MMGKQRVGIEGNFDCDWTHHLEEADDITKQLGYLYYQKGKTVREIIDGWDVGLSYNAINRRLKSLRYIKKSTFDMSEEEIEEIVLQMHKDGFVIEDMTLKYEISNKTISAIVKKHGLSQNQGLQHYDIHKSKKGKEDMGTTQKEEQTVKLEVSSGSLVENVTELLKEFMSQDLGNNVVTKRVVVQDGSNNLVFECNYTSKAQKKVEVKEDKGIIDYGEFTPELAKKHLTGVDRFTVKEPVKQEVKEATKNKTVQMVTKAKELAAKDNVRQANVIVSGKNKKEVQADGKLSSSTEKELLDNLSLVFPESIEYSSIFKPVYLTNTKDEPAKQVNMLEVLDLRNKGLVYKEIADCYGVKPGSIYTLFRAFVSGVYTKKIKLQK